jgi:hypothetical protein
MDRFKPPFAVLAALAIAISTLHAGQPKTQNPDLTNGGKVPAEKIDWTLGPTGLRGWMYYSDFTTDQARQVAITVVEKGSPADGIMQVSDVILGVAGKPFSKDPRVEFGEAITHAETEAGKGNLVLTRWREGRREEVTIKIATLGSYSATAPFNCPKSKLIFEQGCKTLAERIAKGSNKIGTIPRCINGLALLASGNSEYLPLLKKEAEWASNFSEMSMRTWYYGYVMMFLSEYILTTGDTSVFPGLQRMALDAAGGQSAVGSWGHTYARPDGRLQGYGMMNAPGIPLTIGLVLAREAGVKDAKVSEAIDKSLKLLRFYVGKGAIPYGDHAPWTETHEDNGKCSAAAVLFNLVGETKTAEFFTRMGVAAHGTFERETGHCGNYFNILWALPAISLAGPHASGEWMKEFGAWYFDLARRWDGTVTHQPPPDLHEDSFNGWDATGSILLGYAQSVRKNLLTGKRSTVPPMPATTVRSLLDDSRGWSRKDRNSFYDRLEEKDLLTRLESWSPTVRERAAAALARKKSNVLPALFELLKSKSADTRVGACEALAAIKGKAAEAVPALQVLLRDENLWVRVKAAEALTDIGQAALPVLPDLLKQLAKPASQEDPRNMEQRFLTFALFSRSGFLRQGMKGVDPGLLREAIAAGLKNEDGRARSDVSNIYDKLSYEELKPLLPAVYDAVLHSAPSGEMFADGVRLKGLEILAKHRIEEGIKACVDYTLGQNPWASEKRTPEIMKILVSYGARAKPVIPELKQIAELFDKGEKDFPKKLSLQKAQFVRDAIQAIEGSKENPELIRMSTASPNR